MNRSIWNRVLAGVEGKGWYWKNDHVYGPHGTMWLGREPWADTLAEFLERMEGRRDRIKRNHATWEGGAHVSAAEALSDVILLVDVLQSLSPSASIAD